MFTYSTRMHCCVRDIYRYIGPAPGGRWAVLQPRTAPATSFEVACAVVTFLGCLARLRTQVQDSISRPSLDEYCYRSRLGVTPKHIPSDIYDRATTANSKPNYERQTTKHTHTTNKLHTHTKRQTKNQQRPAEGNSQRMHIPYKYLHGFSFP